MPNLCRIIAVDDEETMLRVISRTFSTEGYAVETFADPAQAIARLQEGPVDLVITDLMMPGIDGFAVLAAAKAVDASTIVIVITAFSSVESAVKAMKCGATDFIPKPFDPDHLQLVVERALENRELRRENIDLKLELDERQHLQHIIGTSKPVQEMKALINKVKETDGTVLITGESGTGKELVAQAIHQGSRRRKARFVPINCGALPDQLLESELFGYEKGAFSGAVSRKKGLLELADGGTLFLDEVGSISPMMQVKLLRFLQEKTFMRLGGQEVIQVDVRVLAATNEDLLSKIQADFFRKDLYYRLNVLTILVPPLRERREDIPLLVRFFIDKYRKKFAKEISGIVAEAEAMLLTAPWEGNVRELENQIERAITLCNGPWIGADDLSLQPLTDSPSRESGTETGYPLHLPLTQVEERHILAVIKAVEGNKSQAAKWLGIDYTTLLRRLKGMEGKGDGLDREE